jgi:aromatic ring-opening dioxygenase catalytic subunit (LigB family)
MDRKILESAILKLGQSPELLAQFKLAPHEVGTTLSLDPYWASVIARGERSRLRAAGVNDGITILVSRWFKDDIGDSMSQDKFHIENSLALPPKNLPKNLVFAAGCSHVPDLLARPEVDPPEAVSRLKAGYERLRDQLAEARPDVILVTADCHFQSFETSAFVVGMAAEHTGSMAFFKRPDLDLTLQGDVDMAQAIVESVRSQNLEVEAAPRVDLDHGLIVPLRQLLPQRDVPVVPIITQPNRSYSPFNARAFGHAIRDAIERSEKRVAMLATGGLSHFLDPGRYGQVDVEFDHFILDMLKAGRGLELANQEPFPLLSHGQYEFLNWLIMLGVVGPSIPAEVHAYEAMKASGGGWTVVNMLLEGAHV